MKKAREIVAGRICVENCRELIGIAPTIKTYATENGSPSE